MTEELRYIEIPAKNLPKGVGPASFCPEMTRAAAERLNESPIHPEMPVKPWMILTLLDAMAERDSLLAEVERLRGCSRELEIECGQLLAAATPPRSADLDDAIIVELTTEVERLREVEKAARDALERWEAGRTLAVSNVGRPSIPRSV